MEGESRVELTKNKLILGKIYSIPQSKRIIILYYGGLGSLDPKFLLVWKPFKVALEGHVDEWVLALFSWSRGFSTNLIIFALLKM